MNAEEKIEGVIKKCKDIMERGMDEKLQESEIAHVLATFLFEFTKLLGQKLIEVRSYEEIEEKGTFKYAGQIDTLHEEGIFPDSLFKEFKALGLSNHIGPSYLRVKGLLTHSKIRGFFARQLYFTIEHALDKQELKEGFILFLPNMTGGAWIGDETRRHAEELSKYSIWKATPYVRGMRKITEVVAKETITNYIEGLLPPPEETACVINFEELRTTAETTQNAIQILRSFGYNETNGVKLMAACVFDYRHKACVARFERLGIEPIYLVDGLTFFKKARELGYINEEQYTTVSEWLADPWKFTEKVLPAIKALVKSDG